jgi:small subunit ribosomal protein S24e
MNIVNKKENKLLHRVEIEAHLEEKAPAQSRQDIKKEIAKKLKVEENLVIVETIKPVYGKKSAVISAYVYEDEKAMKAVTPAHMLKRNIKEEAKKEEQ